MKKYCNVRDSYKDYKKSKIEDIKRECKGNKEDIRLKKAEIIPLSVYLDVVYGFMLYLMKKVIEGYKVILPSKLGIVHVIGRKLKIKFDDKGEPIGLPPDWKATNEYWNNNPGAKEKGIKIYHENNHTSGVLYRFVWSKRKILIKNKSLYSFRFTRGNRSLLSQSIKNGKRYIIIT